MDSTQIYKIIENKYDRLIWSIAKKISGDYAISNVEDNYQDLWLAAFEAVEGFTKQNNYSNGPVEDWIETKPFDKYIKTCLWNKKCHKGKLISKKYEIHRDTVPTHLEEVLNVSAPNSTEVAGIFDDLFISLTNDENEAVVCLLADPDKYLTEQGKIKISPIQRRLKWDRRRVSTAIEGVRKKMEIGVDAPI